MLDHVLMVAASRTTATDETLAITGELPEVTGGLDLCRGSFDIFSSFFWHEAPASLIAGGCS